MTNPNDPIQASEHEIASGLGGTIPPRWKHLGLTKREYFAAMAMQGIIANQEELDDSIDEAQEAEYFYYESVSRKALLFADALIKELNK